MTGLLESLSLTSSFKIASADKTIKIWTKGILSKTLVGHKDVVRSLLPIPDYGFASCSN